MAHESRSRRNKSFFNDFFSKLTKVAILGDLRQHALNSILKGALDFPFKEIPQARGACRIYNMKIP